MYRFILFTLISFCCFAQTPEQVRWMNENSSNNLPPSVLEDLKAELAAKSARVRSFARANNIPLIGKDENGITRAIYDVINGEPIFLYPDNTRAAAYTRITQLQDNQLLNLNLSGSGLKVYVWDGGHARISHNEFQDNHSKSKITIGEGISAYSLDSHATHVTGTIVAKGNRFDVRGGANNIDEIIAYDFFDAEQEAFDLIGEGILVSNHSYGLSASELQTTGQSNIFGSYNNRSRNWDLITYSDPYHLHVTSAGNIGNGSFNDDPLDPSKPEYDKLTGAKTSKNTLVVANAVNAVRTPKGDLISAEIATSSSQGPTDDLRIKPDITGIGTFILSTESANDNAYGLKSGTSMAAPNVSGAALLLQELYEREIGNLALSATIKGMLLHTADDAGMTGPDAIFGWGIMNAENAAKLILNNQNSSLVDEKILNDEDTYSIEVYSNGVDPLVASISWTDIHDDLNINLNDPTPRIVNDLDIKITQGVDEFFPWKLTGVDSNTTGVNDVDNFEKIEIPLAEGTYTIEVSHKGSLVTGSQAYTLIVSGLSPTPVTCVSPLELEIENVTSTTASIEWQNSIYSTDGYLYALMEPGKNPEEYEPILEGSVAFELNELILSDLSPITNYDLFVKSNCGSETSLWNSIEFTTECGVVNAIPFTENFNPNSGGCWSVNNSGDSFWGYQIGISHNSTTTMPISGGRMAAFISDNLGDVIGLVSPYFENDENIDLEVGFYFIQPLNSGQHNTTRILLQENADSPVEILTLDDDVNEWEEIRIPIGNISEPFRIIIETTDDGGVFTAIDNFQIRLNGFIFKDWVWSPRNPQEVSTEDDSWFVLNNSSTLTKQAKAKDIFIEENAILEIGNRLKIEEGISGDGLLRFLHNGNLLGQLDEVPSVANISAKVEVQRWAPAEEQNRKAFRMVSSSVTSDEPIYNNWQEDGLSPEGFGTHITGSSAGSNGFDVNITGNPSLFVFDHDETNQSGGMAWEAINNTDINTIEAGKAYRIFVRGDRQIDLSNANSSPTNTILRSVGILHTGNYSATLAQGDAQFSFVGNPYPSVVNMNQLTYSADVNNSYYYIWDPSLNTQGGFATIELPSGFNLMAGSDANNFLMPGQGFFIRNNLSVSGSPSLTFSESAKSVEENPTSVFNSDEDEIIDLKLQQENQTIEVVRVRLNDIYSNEVSDLDAAKLGNPNENLALVKGNALFSIGCFAFDSQLEIPLFLNQTGQGTYHFSTEILSEKSVYLKDNYLNVLIELNSETDYSFDIIEAVPASQHILRFSLVFTNETLTNETFEATDFTMYPNPTESIITIALPSIEVTEISLFDMNGRSLGYWKSDGSEAKMNISLDGLNSGIYLVQLKNETQVGFQKLIKK